TEISEQTRDVLIEVAEFAPLSIRNTARRLNLHSDSSFRFERGVDPCQLDWASRRCCELILATAGGELARDCVWAGEPPPQTPCRVRLRFAQVPRLLGIDVPPAECVQILEALGCRAIEQQPDGAEFLMPSWRRDLQREVDLIEEVARIAGYDRIPEDAVVPVRLSRATLRDRVIDRVHQVLTARGFFEAITPSLVSEEQFGVFDPHPEAERIRVDHGSWKLESTLRHTLIPSLLHVRGENERRGNGAVDLYEIANVYLALKPGDAEAEQTRVAFVTSRPFLEAKGIVQLLLQRIAPDARLEAEPLENALFTAGRAARLLLEGQTFGWLGEVSRNARERLDLHEECTVVELRLAELERHARLIPQFREFPRYPAVLRDLNFVLDEAVRWAELEAVIRRAAGPLLKAVSFGGQYRGKQIPPGKKSYLVTLTFQAADRTLTSDEVDAAQNAVIEACREKLGATLRG
ncbi:MAG: phenylalanine--tRNA ligase subunit beta, partial [Planctomycetota bacterium]